MENFHKIAFWAAHNKLTLNTRFERLTYVNEWLPGYFDFSAKIESNNRKYVGRSISQNSNESIGIALVEAIERMHFDQKIQLGINGTAAHFDPILAQEAAKMELIERDFFLCHHLLKIPFQRGQLDLSFLPEITLLSLQTKMKEHSIDLSVLYSKSGPYCLSVSLARFHNHANKPFVRGFGLSQDAATAAKKSFFEIIRNISFISSSLTLPSSNENMFVGFSVENRQNYDYLEKTNTDPQFEIPVLEHIEVHESTETFSANGLNVILSFAEASSEIAQRLFSGAPELKHINRLRLRQVCDLNNLDIEVLNMSRHPIG